MKRRTALRLISGASVAGLGCGNNSTGAPPSTDPCDGETSGEFPAGRASVVRKGASAMTPEEIERFKEAWALLVANGDLGKIAIGHSDLAAQRHHGVQIRADYTAQVNPPSYADRFLCWHRAYVLDLEQAMRAALVADYQARGLDCAVADRVFVPYLDGTEYPQWVRDWIPTGTKTGILVRHADDRITAGVGHESDGLALGELYEVIVRAYEGTAPTCPTLPPSSRLITEALAPDSFTEMSNKLEFMVGVINDTPDPALANVVRAAAEDIVDKEGQNSVTYESFQGIANVIEAGGWLTTAPDEKFGVVQGLTALDRGRGFTEYGIENWTDSQYDQVLGAVNAYIQRSPHGVLHFFSAGESKREGETGLYGSAAYVSDAGADPHFYMLHCELDRYFATWLASHTDMPQLTGDDRLFKTWDDGTEWTLEELMSPEAMPFEYDALWSA